jgi:hypothetical protein
MKKLTEKEIKKFFELRQRMFDELEMGAEATDVTGGIYPVEDGSFKWLGEQASVGSHFTKEVGKPLKTHGIY